MKKSQPIIFKTEGSPDFHQTLTGITTTVRLPLLLWQPSGLPPGLAGSLTAAEGFHGWCGAAAEEEQSSSVAGFQVLRGIKESWNLGKAPVPLCPLFSLCSFPHCQLFLPHPLCIVVLHIFESWPFPPPPFPLPSLSYHCCLLQLLSPELPHPVPHPEHIHTASHKDNPSTTLHQTPFWPFTLSSPVQLLCKALSEQESPCLGCGVTAASHEELWRASSTAHATPSRPRQVSGCSSVVTCAVCTWRQLWGHD